MSHFCDPLLYEKNSRKIRNISTTLKFKLNLCYGLEHLCTKLGENLLTQTWVIVSTRVWIGHFCDPYCTKKILEKSEKYVWPPKSNSSIVMVSNNYWCLMYSLGCFSVYVEFSQICGIWLMCWIYIDVDILCLVLLVNHQVSPHYKWNALASFQLHVYSTKSP